MSDGMKAVGITRRGFLAASAVAAGLTIVKPGQVRGTEANSRIEVGCVGLGGRGTLIANKLAAHSGYKVKAVADYFKDVSVAAGKRYGVAKDRVFWGLEGYKRLLASGVDAVFLETPPYCFSDHVKASVDAGCHVYIAKPLGCDAPDCMSIFADGKRATKKNKVFLCDFQTRTDEFFIEGVKRVVNGDIGKVGLIDSVYTDNGFSDPALTESIASRLRHLIWVNDVELGGGYIVNAGIHAIDVGLWIANGRPVSATGGARRLGPAKGHGNSNEVYSVTYEFADGTIMNHHGEHMANRWGFRSENKAYGQKGHLETAYQDGGQVRLLTTGKVKGYRGGEMKGLYVRGIDVNLNTFHNSVINGVYDNPTLEPSVNSTLAAILGREAGNRGSKLGWDEMIRENKRLEVDYSGMEK